MKLTQILAGAAAVAVLAGCSQAVTPTAPASAPASQPETSAPATTAPATPTTDPTGASAAGTLTAECLALTTAMSKSSAELQASAAQAAKDPKKALEALDKFGDTWDKAAEAVTDAKLKAQLAKAGDALKKLVTAMKAAVKDPRKAADMQTAVGDWQQEVKEIGDICQS